jgi:mono/diheme cytochrome c family protein
MVRTAIGVAAAAWLLGILPAAAQDPLERGKYLVEGLLTCGNCHSPRGPGGIDQSRAFSGGMQEWDTPAFKVKGANITPDPETGIGKWTTAQIKTALSEGKRPDGVQLAPIMPYGFYKVFTPGDLDAVVLYVKSLKPVRNVVQPPVYKTAMHVEVPPGGDKPMSDADMKDPLKRGFYIATIAHCMECHTPMVRGQRVFSDLGKGGFEFQGPWGVSVARNITSHKEKGLGGWTDAEIKRAITQGIRKDGTRLKPPMGFDMYAKMTDEDLTALVAYLRTVPAKE